MTVIARSEWSLSMCYSEVSDGGTLQRDFGLTEQLLEVCVVSETTPSTP